jgi:hypothetical protein
MVVSMMLAQALQERLFIMPGGGPRTGSFCYLDGEARAILATGSWDLVRSINVANPASARRSSQCAARR